MFLEIDSGFLETTLSFFFLSAFLSTRMFRFLFFLLSLFLSGFFSGRPLVTHGDFEKCTRCGKTNNRFNLPVRKLDKSRLFETSADAWFSDILALSRSCKDFALI